MKTESKAIKGTAYLLGDEKSTTNLVAGIMMLVPEDRKAEVRKLLEDRLIAKFEFAADIKVPETLDEAVDMLPSGRESMTKMVISKAVTNQMDKLRNEHAAALIKAADVPSIIAKATSGK